MLTDKQLAEYIRPRFSPAHRNRIVGYNVSVPYMSKGRKYYRQYISVNESGRKARFLALAFARLHYTKMLDNDLQYRLDTKNQSCYHDDLSIAKGFYVSVYNRNGFIEPKVRVAVNGFAKEYCCVVSYRGGITAALNDYFKCVIHPNADPDSVAKFKATIMKRIPTIDTVNKHTVEYGKKDNKQVRLVR